MIYIGLVNDHGSPHFAGAQPWSSAALLHNLKAFEEVTLITERTPIYQQMREAARRTVGESWASSHQLGTLSIYVAIQHFLESGASKFVWIEADMLRNTSVELDHATGLYRVCQVTSESVWEKYKRQFAEAAMKGKHGEYGIIQSTYACLDRYAATDIITGLDVCGLELLYPKGWKRVADIHQAIGGTEQMIFSDMVLEIGHMAMDMDMPSVETYVGWVDKDPDWEWKPLVHFHTDRKSKILTWPGLIR